MDDENSEENEKDRLRRELHDALRSGAGPRAARYALAVLGGAIPIAGGVVSGGASAWSEQNDAYFKDFLKKWLQLQEDEIREIGTTLFEVISRLDHTDETVRQRIER